MRSRFIGPKILELMQQLSKRSAILLKRHLEN